jgi:hypothetical protein
MTRARRVLFGSFGERLSTAVFIDDWWLFRASDVKLDTEARTTFELETSLRALAPDRIPNKPDPNWFQTLAPIGLSLRPADLADSPLSLGFVASRVNSNSVVGGQSEDLAYPFILVESEARLHLEFSTTGPAEDIKRQIVRAFCHRLLWQGTIGAPVAE